MKKKVLVAVCLAAAAVLLGVAVLAGVLFDLAAPAAQDPFALFWQTAQGAGPDSLAALLEQCNSQGYEVYDDSGDALHRTLTGRQLRQLARLLRRTGWQPVSIEAQAGFAGALLGARSPEGDRLYLTCTPGTGGESYPLLLLRRSDGLTGYFIAPAADWEALRQFAAELRADGAH